MALGDPLVLPLEHRAAEQREQVARAPSPLPHVAASVGVLGEQRRR